MDCFASLVAVLGGSGFFASGAASFNSFASLATAFGATPSSTSYPFSVCTSSLSFLIRASISAGDLCTFAAVLFMIFLAL